MKPVGKFGRVAKARIDPDMLRDEDERRERRERQEQGLHTLCSAVLASEMHPQTVPVVPTVSDEVPPVDSDVLGQVQAEAAAATSTLIHHRIPASMTVGEQPNVQVRGVQPVESAIRRWVMQEKIHSTREGYVLE